MKTNNAHSTTHSGLGLRAWAFALLAVSAGPIPTPLHAENSRDTRLVKKDLVVDGALEVAGDEIRVATGAAGDDVDRSYVLRFEGEAVGDALWSSALRMVATLPAHRWLWQTAGLAYPITRMLLDENGRLVLPGFDGPGLVFDPDAPAIEPAEEEGRFALQLRRFDLVSDGGLILGADAPEVPGSLRWTGVDFEGFNGERWCSLLVPEEILERDPVFASSTAAMLRAQDLERWDAAWIWGDHGDAGYLTAQADADPVTIDASGQLGLGTAEPAARLHVVGSVRIDGPLFVEPQGDIPLYQPGETVLP